MTSLGRVFLLLGLFFLLLGGILSVAGRLHIPFGRLPGDIAVERGNGRFYFPIATSIIVSLLLTLILNLAFRLWRR